MCGKAKIMFYRSLNSLNTQFFSPADQWTTDHRTDRPQPKWSRDLKYSPCPPTRDRGSRVLCLVLIWQPFEVLLSRTLRGKLLLIFSLECECAPSPSVSIEYFSRSKFVNIKSIHWLTLFLWGGRAEVGVQTIQPFSSHWEDGRVKNTKVWNWLESGRIGGNEKPA